MSAEHSPLPWIAAVGIKPSYIYERYAIQMVYYDEHGSRCTRFIADVLPTHGYENELEGNARLIVTAVNSHAELLAAARYSVSGIREQNTPSIARLREIIAKAEEAASPESPK